MDKIREAKTMKRSINHKRYSGYPEELSLLKGFKVVGVGCGDIEKEGATSIMLMMTTMSLLT